MLPQLAYQRFRPVLYEVERYISVFAAILRQQGRGGAACEGPDVAQRQVAVLPRAGFCRATSSTVEARENIASIC
jgi:hypothetical protein